MLGRGDERPANGAGTAVVVAALNAAGFEALQVWDVGPSAEDPVELLPQPAATAPDRSAAAAFLVTARASAEAKPCMLARALLELSSAAKEAPLRVRRVVNSTRGK